jgi:hypothetical protein
VGKTTMRSGAKLTKAVADNRRCPWPLGEGFCLALLLGATTYLSAAHLLSNIGLIPLSRAAVYTAQILIIPRIVAFARKIASENREKMKQPAVVGINGSWNRQRKGSAHILDIVDLQSRSVVDFEIVQRTNASGRGNYEGSSNGMESNGSGSNEVTVEEMGKRSKSVGCSDGPGLKNGEGDSRISLECQARIRRKPHQKGAGPLLLRNSKGGATAAVRAGEALSGLVQSRLASAHRS